MAIDPFMQVSEPVNLRLVSRLQPVFSSRQLGPTMGVKPFVFQVFSLPLFSYTGAVSQVQKYNLQVRKEEKVLLLIIYKCKFYFDYL